MKIWRYHEVGDIGNLRLEDAPIPTPAAGEVLVRLHFAALNPADSLVVRGLYPRSGPPPMAVGRDGSGVVESAAPGSRFKPGDRVVFLRSEVGVTRDGTLAEFCAAPEGALAPLPDGWTMQEGAAGPLVLRTAWLALVETGGLQAGQTVLITGASGGVGTAAVMLAHALGARVIAASRSAEKRARLKSLGADITVDSTSPERMESETKHALGDARVDVVIENLSGPYLQSSLNLLAERGRIAVVGLLSRFTAELILGSLIFKRARIEGVAIGGSTFEEGQETWRKILACLSRTGARPIIDSEHAMVDVPQAFARLAAGPMGKVLIRIGD